MVANCTAIIPADPDINGIGIRVSVYVTTVLLSLLPRIPETEDLRSALSSAAGLQATALTVTVLVKTKAKELSLYHAIIIFHLLLFLGVNVDHAGPISGSIFKVTLHSVGAWIALLLYLSWSIHLWSTTPAFGPEAIRGCNSQVQYAVFFKNVRATASWIRWFFVSLSGLGLFVLILIPLLTVIIWFFVNSRGRSRYSVESGSEDDDDTSSDRTASLRFLAAIYSVVMLELTVQRNALLVQDGEKKWGFGQIAAMVILLSPVNEILHALLSLLAYEGSVGGERRRAFGRALLRIIPFSTYWLARRKSRSTDVQVA